jgi:hypothetical protein
MPDASGGRWTVRDINEQDVNGGRCRAILFHEGGEVDRCQQVIAAAEDDTCYYHSKLAQGLCEPCEQGEGALGSARVYRMEILGTTVSRTF